MWVHFMDGVLKACDNVCGKKRWRRSKGDILWWAKENDEAANFHRWPNHNDTKNKGACMMDLHSVEIGLTQHKHTIGKTTQENNSN